MSLFLKPKFIKWFFENTASKTFLNFQWEKTKINIKQIDKKNNEISKYNSINI